MDSIAGFKIYRLVPVNCDSNKIIVFHSRKKYLPNIFFCNMITKKKK